MKAAVISLGSKSSVWVAEAMEQYFTSVDTINIKDIEINLGAGNLDVLCKGKPIDQYDCVYAKGSFRYAQLLRSITAALQDTTYMPIKAETFTIGHDKLLTHLALQQLKIPMPKTYLASSQEGAKKILKKINYPITFKFPQGTQGKGVMFADSYASAASLLDALEALKQPFIIQEYVETSGVDIRAIVVGNKVVASMKRKAVIGEKRANIHAGGTGEATLLDTHTQKIAVDTAKSIGADICAVDILESIKGPVVIEANLSPGLQGITKTTGINVAEKTAKFLFEKTKEFKESDKKTEATKIFEDLGIETKTEQTQQIISNIDFRAGRMLLPKIISDITKFDDKEELIIKAKKGKLYIERFTIKDTS